MRRVHGGQGISLLLILILGLLGCAPSMLPAGNQPEGGASSLATGHGSLLVQVRWPIRDLPNFSAQTIPVRTNSIRLTVRKGQSEFVAQQLIQRTPGFSTVSTASISLDVGTGYSVAVEAFEEAAPTPNSTVIAQGNAINLTIRKSRITSVPITLTATFVPTILALSPETGPFETPFTISGTRFGASQNLTYSVSMGGIAIQALRVSDTRIDATASVGARSGNVVVTVDGVPSSTVALFQLIQGFDANIVPNDQSYGDNGMNVRLNSNPGATPMPAPSYGNNGLDVLLNSKPGATPTPAPSYGNNGLDVLIKASATPIPSASPFGNNGLDVTIKPSSTPTVQSTPGNSGLEVTIKSSTVQQGFDITIE